MSEPKCADADRSPRPCAYCGLDLVRVTEAAALAASRWMGLGDRAAADCAAQEAMAEALDLLPMQGTIVSGEERRLGEHSPLDSGHVAGTGTGPELDVQVNAIDGASLVAMGKPGAVSVAALAPAGSLWRPGAAIYMDKLVVGSRVADALTPEALDAPVAWTLAMVARQLDKDLRDLVVFVLERDRHFDLIDEIRKAGARAILRPEGDIGSILLAADPHGAVDVLMGVGGAAEGLLGACAVKALGGAMLGRPAPQSPDEHEACLEAGLDLDRVLTVDDLVAGDRVFFAATGVTSGLLLDGVHHRGDFIETRSLALRSDTGTRRLIHTEHRLR